MHSYHKHIIWTVLLFQNILFCFICIIICFKEIIPSNNNFFDLSYMHFYQTTIIYRGIFFDLVANVRDWDIMRGCALQSSYHVHFRANIQSKSMKSHTILSMASIVLTLLFYIKWPTKIDMPLNKENEEKYLEVNIPFQSTKKIKVKLTNKNKVKYYGFK